MAGWGLTDSEGTEMQTSLLDVTVRILDNSVCKGSLDIGNLFQPGETFCTYAHHRDSCSGDSGGPVIYETSPMHYVLLGM